MAGGCDSLQSCSKILSGLGGSLGKSRNMSINGRDVAGNCVTAAPLNSFCQSSTLFRAISCARCLPRTDYTKKQLPSGLGYAGLGVLLGRSNGFREFSNNVQYGVHNSIHNTLASTMATYVASADPVYFSHHATIDLLHQIYLECQLGPSVRNSRLLVSRFAFQTCSWSGQEVCPTIASNFTQLWSLSVPNAKGPPIPVEQSALAPFFSCLPSEYWQFVTIKDLGVHSYDYQKDDLMTNLEANGFTCPRQQSANGAPTPTPTNVRSATPTSTPTPTPTQSPTPTPTPTLKPIPTPSNVPTPRSTTVRPPGRRLQFSIGGVRPRPTPAPPLAQTPAPAADPAATPSPPDDAPPAADDPQSMPTSSGFSITNGGPEWDQLQAERRAVQRNAIQYLRAAIDGIAWRRRRLLDYFRDNFPVAPQAHTRCFNLLEALRLGDVTLRVADWRQYYRNFFSIRAITTTSSTPLPPTPSPPVSSTSPSGSNLSGSNSASS
ncbi:hypothetical protein PINS_up008478 [Pythium insidiosum]|nr:hypothetical protein PINS_up008478 [Pythium insidiosum]